MFVASFLLGSLYVLLTITALVLMGIILIQDSKAGGLSGAFGGAGGDAVLGTSGAKAISKVTAWISVVFFILCIAVGKLKLAEEGRSIIRTNEPVIGGTDTPGEGANAGPGGGMTFDPGNGQVTLPPPGNGTSPGTATSGFGDPKETTPAAGNEGAGPGGAPPAVGDEPPADDTPPDGNGG